MKANQHVIRSDGGTLLHIAAEYALHNQIGIDLALSVTDLDINASNNDGRTPIQLAVAKQNVRAVKSFLQHPNINIHTGLSSSLEIETDHAIYELEEDTTLLYIAIATNNVPIVELLLNAGIDYTQPSVSGRQLLDEAIVYDAVDVIEFFVKHTNPKYRLDIIQSTTLDSPYHVAFTFQSRRVLDWLMRNNIDGINLTARHYDVNPYTIFQRSMF